MMFHLIAECSTVSRELFPYSDNRQKAIVSDLRSNFYFKGQFFPCRIEDAGAGIDYGDFGEITLNVLINGDGLEYLLTPGAQFELKEGPHNLLAKCVVKYVL